MAIIRWREGGKEGGMEGWRKVFCRKGKGKRRVTTAETKKETEKIEFML